MRSRCLQRPGVGPLALLLAASVIAAIAGTTYGAFSSTTSNSGNSFQASGIFPCGSIAPLWMNGLENGYVSTSGTNQFSSISNGGGTIVADSSVTRNGGYSLKIPDTSVLGASNAQFAVSGSTVVARFGIRLNSLPGNVNLAFIDAGTDLVFGYNNVSQKFELTSGFTTVASSSTVSAGTWYLIDLRASFAANPNTADWKINGVAQTGLSSAVASSTAVAIGWGSSSSLQTYTANYDDILVSLNSTDYPFGDGRILRLGPIATTYPVTEFQDHDSTPLDANSFGNLDELPMTTTGDYIKQITTGATSYVQVDFSNPGECVKAVFATLAYSNTTAGANNGKTSIFDGGTERVVFSGDMNTTAITYQSAYIAPASSPWTETTINGVVARIGYSTDVSPTPEWHALGLEYETKP
jgi:hypothetical protein